MDTSIYSDMDPEIAAVVLFASRLEVIRWCMKALSSGLSVLAQDGRLIACGVCGARFERGDGWVVRADLIDSHLRREHLPEILRKQREVGLPLKLSP